jgi:pentatricopeptide repeat protein
VVPDEGLCLDVLHACGRNGMPVLASEVLSLLTEQKITLGEHHFGSLIEAMCHQALIKDAFSAIMRMGSVGISPTSETTYPIFQYIVADAERLETACNHLENLQQEAKTPFHVAAFNCLIRASISLGDLQRAIGLYNSLSEFEVKPDVETYNLLLGGCIAAAHRELGDKLLLEMKDALVLPDARTYERLIVLCLTQTSYEDAFFYLEEMKGQKMIPSLNIYESLIRKCVTMGDMRYKLAVEELEECGYKVSGHLRGFIDTGGKGRSPPATNERFSKYAEGVKDYKRRQFFRGAET